MPFAAKKIAVFVIFPDAVIAPEVNAPVPAFIELLLVKRPVVQVPAISIPVVPVPVLLTYIPFSVVPVPVLVKDNNFWVPAVVLFVKVPEYKFTPVPIEVSETVYVELKG